MECVGHTEVVNRRKFKQSQASVGNKILWAITCWLNPNCWELWQSQGRKHYSNILFHQFAQAVADNQKSRPSATTINNERETWQTTRTRPSATAIDEEREHNISDHMVGNKICTRHQELGRCTSLCKQDTAHVTLTKTDKQPNGGKGKPITELPREDKNKHNLALIKKEK